MEISPLKKDTAIPIIARYILTPWKPTSKSENTSDAKIIGIDSKNEKDKLSFFSFFNSRLVDKVAPLLLIPGRQATPCIAPIITLDK